MKARPDAISYYLKKTYKVLILVTISGIRAATLKADSYPKKTSKVLLKFRDNQII